MATLFVYGTFLPGETEHHWIVGLPLASATVRGSLWRGSRNRPALLPDPAGRPIRGALVEVDDARLGVLDLVEQAGGGPLRRAPVRAVRDLRTVRAEAWILDAPPRGWRRLAADAWGSA